jgi:hypothetical protein
MLWKTLPRGGPGLGGKVWDYGNERPPGTTTRNDCQPDAPMRSALLECGAGCTRRRSLSGYRCLIPTSVAWTCGTPRMAGRRAAERRVLVEELEKTCNTDGSEGMAVLPPDHLT